MLLLKSDEYVGHDHSIRVLSREPQVDYPEHRHDFSELVLISSGCGIHIVNGHHSVVLPNTVACVSDRDYHQYIDNKDVNLLNILYNKNHLPISRCAADVIKRLESNHSHFLINAQTFGQLHAIGQQIKQEQLSAEKHSNALVQLLFEQLLLCLDRLECDKYQHAPVMHAIIYLCNNYSDQDLSVQGVCELFQISPKSLSTQLQSLTGLSSNSFINQLRIRKAMSLLKAGKSVTQVAFSVGYNDSNYFSTKFKSTTGESPRSYLRKCN
ncbi:hypothetical protein BOO22_03985 [Vibrio cidicii]|uniref:helix-turn-helix domain-containing protein n=1 Tax=Vibrio cidicii TaxID=1763883 RepID=UPI0018C21C9E|nr:helix-turn-helix domain-containing protein [Vibrio cidicii]MBG0758567.1 hypothetical protein [Vibrio cidicii]